MQPLCPGKEQFVKDAQDLDWSVFRRLVGRRARQLVDPELRPASDEDERREQERLIQEKVHKVADFLPASFLRDGASSARGVCRISTETSLGTGFLIARGILMTNNHVLETKEVAAASVAEFGFEEGRDLQRVPIEPDRLFITDEGLDFTIVACDDQILNGIEPIPLRRNPALVTRHERVNVIQHPRGRRKEVALHDNRVLRVLDKVVRYRTDTEPGSSGSPVFNNEWDLVALHHAGVGEPDGGASNEGIRISAIVAHLLSRMNERSTDREAFEAVLRGVTDTSPYLGFFDVNGLADGLEIEVPDFRGSKDFADVGVWNIEHFNDRVSNDRVEDVAEVVARLGLDVLGLTEVQDGAMQRLVNALGRRGHAAEFELLNVPGSQDLAVLFDRETTTVKIRKNLAHNHRRKLKATTPSGRTVFPRPPFFVECRVDEEQGSPAMFLLILVHLKAFGDSESRARRRMAAEILAEIIEDVREREGLPVVLGGDFNERLDTDVLAALKSAPDLFSMTADDAVSGAISFVGDHHRSLIDHIIISRDVVPGDIMGDDAAIVRLDRGIRGFADRVSDHVPVVFRMVYRDAPVPVPDPTVPEGVSVHIPDGAKNVNLRFNGTQVERSREREAIPARK